MMPGDREENFKKLLEQPEIKDIDTLITTANNFIVKKMIFWTEVVSVRGNISASPNRTSARITGDDLIKVKVPGVHLITGMVQYKAVILIL